MEDYYDILEIQRGVPKKEIKKAFYRLGKKKITWESTSSDDATFPAFSLMYHPVMIAVTHVYDPRTNTITLHIHQPKNITPI